MTTGPHTIDDLVDALREQNERSTVASRVRTTKEVVAAILFLVALVAGAAVTLSELQAKPTMEDMDQAVEEHRRDEVHTQTGVALDSISRDVQTMQERTDRMEQVQVYILESLAWQGDVLEHLARKRKGSPPRRPDSLRRMERELIR